MAHQKLDAVDVARVFNADAPANWSARGYVTTRRKDGVINGVSFKYKSNVMWFRMDCDEPLETAFRVEFTDQRATFGVYLASIQKGLYRILTVLHDAGLSTMGRPASFSDIEFAIRRDGAINRVRLVPPQKSDVDDLL